MSAKPSSSITLQAEVSELERLNRWIESLCAHDRIPPPLAFRVDLCLTEVVTNVINYAYPAEPVPREATPRELAVHCFFSPEELVFELVDHGIGFDPTAYVLPAPPTSLEDAEIGGRGLRLVRQYVGSMRYRRDGRDNHLELRFPRQAVH